MKWIGNYFSVHICANLADVPRTWRTETPRTSAGRVWRCCIGCQHGGRATS